MTMNVKKRPKIMGQRKSLSDRVALSFCFLFLLKQILVTSRNPEKVIPPTNHSAAIMYPILPVNIVDWDMKMK